MVANVKESQIADFQGSQRFAAFSKDFATHLLPRLLTVREVAAALKVCTATVYKLCSAGKLSHVRVSGAIRVPVAAVERLIGTFPVS